MYIQATFTQITAFKKEGKFIKIPYGVMRDANGSYAINEKEADTIRLIFHLYLTEYSLGKIVSHLEALIPRYRHGTTSALKSTDKRRLEFSAFDNVGMYAKLCIYFSNSGQAAYNLHLTVGQRYVNAVADLPAYER